MPVARPLDGINRRPGIATRSLLKKTEETGPTQTGMSVPHENPIICAPSGIGIRACVAFSAIGLQALGSLPQSESHFRAPASDIRSAVVIFMYFHFGVGECFLYIEIRKYKEEVFGSLGNIPRGKEVLRVV
jgi:hypothetical protein